MITRKRNIVIFDLSFSQALDIAAKYKQPVKFFSGVSWHCKPDQNNPEIDRLEAERLAEQPGVQVIFFRPIGSRPCEIVIQD